MKLVLAGYTGTEGASNWDISVSYVCLVFALNLRVDLPLVLKKAVRGNGRWGLKAKVTSKGV